MEVNDKNQPTGCTMFQEKYGKYNAYYIAPDAGNKIYLTFDEGYENGYTEAILDTLKQENVKAIFFITGDYFEKNDAIIRRMLEEGHEVGNHTMRHYSLPELNYEKCENEILELDRLFYNKFGRHMRFLRPPKGDVYKRQSSHS